MKPYKEIDWPRVRLDQKIVKGVDQNIYTFDIEVSSGYLPSGSDHVIPFDYSKDPSFYRECEKVSLCYEWQFGINDRYYYGRELYEFLQILIELDKIFARFGIKCYCTGLNSLAEFADKKFNIAHVARSENISVIESRKVKIAVICEIYRRFFIGRSLIIYRKRVVRGECVSHRYLKISGVSLFSIG